MNEWVRATVTLYSVAPHSSLRSPNELHVAGGSLMWPRVSVNANLPLNIGKANIFNIKINIKEEVFVYFLYVLIGQSYTIPVPPAHSLL